MQLMPATARRLSVRKPFDPASNVRGGVQYLRELVDRYGQHPELVLAAYNAGEGAVDRYRGVPPYDETREYVKRVMTLFRREHHPYDPSVADPSPVVTGPRPQEKL